MSNEVEQEDGLWEKAVGVIQARMGDDVAKTWFQQTSLGSINGTKATILVPNEFYGGWLGHNYRQAICDALHVVRPSVAGVVDLEFVVSDQPDAAPTPADGPPVPQGTRTDQPTRRSSLNPHYTFDTFVVGASNEFAHAASLAVAEGRAPGYNPFFICGGVGLGKTHLLHSIGNSVRQERGLHIAYVTTEQFTNEVINSIRHDKMREFRKRYRSIDILLIDDIQFLEGKVRTQEEFFHTFNSLYEAKKQVVVSGDQFPGEMTSVPERLRSRFGWGLLADLQPPDFETRIAILRKKSEERGIAVGNDVLNLLANSLTRNIRELEGALTRLEAYARLTGRTMTPDTAKMILRDLLITEVKVVRVPDIQEAVARRYGKKVSDLKSKRRTGDLVMPRQVAMYLARKLTNASFPEIGREFGGKDHTTIMHACRQIDKAIETDHETRITVDKLKDEIGKAR
ncbi:MAG: chromosomal replication initiator protein DnaA [Nitrospira sp.]|nr:chromosomal replication initiator protein DnaA [Nitrospira sp.]